jgi:DnaK suppressor protein
MMTSQQAVADVAQLSEDALARLRHLLAVESGIQAARLCEHRAMVSELRGATDTDSTLERELSEAGAVRAREAIEDIERALQRLDAGTYGSCESCGRPIPFERLEAIPAARFCVACTGYRPGWPALG